MGAALPYWDVEPRYVAMAVGRCAITVEGATALVDDDTTAGSVALGPAALGAFVLPTTGEPARIVLVNLGTFLGAVGFLVGAALLVPDQAGAGGPRPKASPALDDEARRVEH